MTVSGARLIQGHSPPPGVIPPPRKPSRARSRRPSAVSGRTTMVALAALVAGFSMLSDDRPREAFVHLQPHFDDDVLGAPRSSARRAGHVRRCGAPVRSHRRGPNRGAVDLPGRRPRAVTDHRGRAHLRRDPIGERRQAEGGFDRALRPRPAVAVPAGPAPAGSGHWLRRHQRVVESRAPLAAPVRSSTTSARGRGRSNPPGAAGGRRVQRRPPA